MSRPTILCPVDFSVPAGGALRYAGTIACHFGADLVVVTVNDPLLVEAAGFSMSAGSLAENCLTVLHQFVRDTFQGHQAPELIFETATGKPDEEILRVARERTCDLIVMSSRGLTGMRKLFFGTTTERVLRETTIPVLITPPDDPGPADLTDIKPAIRRILAPVDLSPASARQTRVAAGIARALSLPLLVAHVVEPVRYAAALQLSLPNIDRERRDQSETAVAELVSTIGADVSVEGVTTIGDAAEEIANLARARDAGLVVIGLHSSSFLGPRMGSVTYRVLCLLPGLVLALPPKPASNA